MGEDTDEAVRRDLDEFETAIEAGLLAEFGCAERDAERVAAAAASARAAGALPAWSPTFVAEKLADAPDRPSVAGKWNWLLSYVGGDADSEEYRLDG